MKKDASQKEIKAAFRKLARKHHPDVNPNDKAAENRFKEINEAHEVLSDADKRSKYDRYGDNWEQAEAFEKARAQHGNGGPGGYSETFQFDINDLLRRQGGGRGAGGIDLGDMLGGIFGGGAPRGPDARPERRVRRPRSRWKRPTTARRASCSCRARSRARPAAAAARSRGRSATTARARARSWPAAGSR